MRVFFLKILLHCIIEKQDIDITLEVREKEIKNWRESLASLWWRPLLPLSLPPTTLLLTVAGVTTAIADTVIRTPSRFERRASPNPNPAENDAVGITATLPIPIPILHLPSLITPGSISIPHITHNTRISFYYFIPYYHLHALLQ